MITVAAPGKVNLCLFLGPVRGDGRHELVTVFESVSLADELRVVPAERDEVVCRGVDGPNLVARAIELLRACGWTGPPLRVEVDKRIPIAGGMGGGSADAAALLRAACRLEPVDSPVLDRVARQLGADVPSQVSPGVSLGTGAGELVEPFAAPPEHALVLVPQPFTLLTADVYREADRLGSPRSAVELGSLAERLRGGDLLFGNDLEPASRSLCPPVAAALDAVRSHAPDQALVSGSGPTVFGLYWGSEASRRAAEVARALQSAYPQAIAAGPVKADYGNPRIA
jgi:4-diphosphocytidyl-2-C-methyl-D-erythritol kinase